MADAVTFDIRIKASGDASAGKAPEWGKGDPRDAIERTRKVASGDAPPRAKFGKQADGGGAPAGDYWGELRALRKEVSAARPQPDPAEAQAAAAWRLRKAVEEVIKERGDGKTDEDRQVVEEMRARLKWLDENFGEDFEKMRKGEREAGAASAIEGGAGHLATAAAFLRNPAQGALTLGSRVAAALPGGPVAVAAVTAATIAAAVIPYVIRHLAQKGWPLNRDYRRSISEEVNGALDARQQEDRLAGRDIYIFAHDQGFGSIDGTNVVNTLYRRDELRINMRTQAEQAVGGFY